MSDFWIQGNNGKKEQLNDSKHGVRKEQVDKKFHNLFDAYDVNKDGTLEQEELEVIKKGFFSFAGSDKTLDINENKKLTSVFAKEVGLEDADFMGFVKSVSDASEDIIESKTTLSPDGGKVVVTTYKDGTKETIAYYPNGDYKYKHTEKHEDTTTTTYIIAGKKYSETELDPKIKKDYQTYKRQQQAQAQNKEFRMFSFTMPYEDYKIKWMQEHKVIPNTNRSKIDIDNLELSEFAKQDVAVRDFVLSHFVETHKSTQEAMDTMGILDDIGAAINAGAGETWNACKNVYNKYFGDGTQEDYQNFYELANKFKPNYDKAVVAGGRLETMRNHPDMYFNGFENEVPNYDIQKGADFQAKTEQYQSAQILNQRIELLKKAKFEIEAYQREQYALIYAPAQNEGLNPASHIVTANKLLLQYCDNDQEAVDLLLNGSISSREGNAQSAAQVQALLDETKKMNEAVLGGKTFDEIKSEYNKQYKEMYGVDFVPDELDDKVMDAKATGGMVKIAAITIISILITKSPAMANIMGAAAGSEAATGASAAFIRTLVSKYGQVAVQQGIKFAMTTGTLATDVGLTMLNQVTDNREGVQWNEVGKSTASAAKYIYFGAYVGSPLAQAVASKIGNIGLASKLMDGGVKSTSGAITTTTISGEKLVQNFMKSGQSLLAKGGALATEIGAFTGLELATGDIDLATAAEEQTKMQLELKLMHNVFEYMLGGKAHTAMQKAKMETAIEKSGVKDWTIKEIKTPKGSQYTVEMNGVPIGRFEDANMLASAMMGRVSMALGEVQNEPAKKTYEKPEMKVVEIKDEIRTEEEQQTKQDSVSKEELTPEILKEKYLDRFSDNDIEALMDYYKTNPELVTELLERKDSDGYYLCTRFDIKKIVKAAETNEKYIREVLNRKKDGEWIYSEGNQVVELAEQSKQSAKAQELAPEVLKNHPKTQELLNKIEFDEPVSEYEPSVKALKKRLLEVSVEIADKIEANPELFEKIVGIAKEKLSVHAYQKASDMANEIKEIMTKNAVLQNAELISKLLDVKYPSGSKMFEDFSWMSEENIESIAKQSQKNPELFEIALRRASDNSYFYNLEDYANRVGNKIQDLKEICDITVVDGERRLYLDELIDLVTEVEDIQTQKETIKKVVNLKDGDGNFKFNRDGISGLVRANAKYNNLEEVLQFADKFSMKDDTYRLAESLAKCKDDSMKEFLLSSSLKAELTKNSAGKYQQEILDMFDIDNIYNNVLFEILNSGLSKDEFLSAVRKMSKSTFKLAYDRPNQYLSNIDTKWTNPVDGKLPELPDDVLSEQRSDIKDFFRSNLGSICRTLKYLDTDTVSHMMDKRTELFKEQLNKLNQLSDDNFALLSQLTQLKSAKSGKNLSPKEKIQLAQIVEIFQSANIDTNMLREYISKGEVDINEPKQIIQNEILKSAGIDIENPDIEISKKKFNEEFSYLALTNSLESQLNSPQMQEALAMLRLGTEKMKKDPKIAEQAISQLESALQDPTMSGMFSPKLRAVNEEYLAMLKEADKYTVDELFDAGKRTIEVALTQYAKNNELFTVIRASVLHDFKDFITDSTNKYGQINAETKAAFEENGLNYDKWLNPDIEDVELNVAGKQMKIKMWDRNPQEDLFMGNKTTCCTAIGTGGNGGATPVYLLNTSYNVVELYDASGNVVGMSRVFMSKVDGKPTLIMDNIELNKTYVKGMTDSQKAEIRDGFFTYMNEYAQQVTGNKDSQVYFYSRDVHVPTDDLAHEQKVTDFVGKVSQDNLYVNSAGCRWIDPTKLKDKGEIDWLVVPKDKIRETGNTQPLTGKTELSNALADVVPPEMITKLLDRIQDEHTAKILSEYFNKYKDDDFQSQCYFMAVADLKTPEIINELVKIIEDSEIGEALKTPDALFMRANQNARGGINRFSVDYLKKVTEAGLDKVRGGSSCINFEEIDSIMARGPKLREALSKIYASKLFSRIEFYKLITADVTHLDLKNLDRIDSMIDGYKFYDTMTFDDAECLLKASDEELNIIDSRNLLKTIPNREKHLTGSEAIDLAHVSDELFAKIQERGLLQDFGNPVFDNPLSSYEAREYASIPDELWTNIQNRNLLKIYPKASSDICSLYRTPDFIKRVARLSDETYNQYRQLIENPTKGILLLDLLMKQGDKQMAKLSTLSNDKVNNIGEQNINTIKIDENAAEEIESLSVAFGEFVSSEAVLRIANRLFTRGTFDQETCNVLKAFVKDLKQYKIQGRTVLSPTDIQHMFDVVVDNEYSSDLSRPRDGVVVVDGIFRISRGAKDFLADIEAQKRIFDGVKNNKYSINRVNCLDILKHVNRNNADVVNNLLNNSNLSNENLSRLIKQDKGDLLSWILSQDINSALVKLEEQRQKVLENPERYINGDATDERSIQYEIDRIFDRKFANFLSLCTIYDKESLNNLLRMRIDDAEEYLYTLDEFKMNELKLLKDLSEATNIDGKPFMPTQKIEFIDLLYAYKENHLETTRIEEMVKNGKIDLAQIHIDLFNQIMKNSGLTEEEIASIPKEKLVAWDTKYAHLLSKEISTERDVAFSDVLRAGNLEPDFMEYIHNPSNVYGKANAQTQNRYNQLGMNYDKWIKPSKNNEVSFVTRDANTEQLQQVAAQITEDMNTLMQTPVKGFLKKQFPKFVKGDEFVIPNEYLTSKSKLQELVRILSDTSEQGQMSAVWNRAKGNAENPDPKRSATARGTLTILDHLNQRLSDIDNISDAKVEKQRNWTVKMWDRTPQKDIFQGNYSTCCIGMGGGNGSAMPHFVMNTAYNMIEIVDNVSGRTVGNALCYFITDADGKPAFIVDNIEINNSVKPSDNIGLQLRDAIVQYAANVSQDVTGNNNTPIYMSSSYNDVPCSDLARHRENISFLGDIDCDEIYMDLYKGWVEKDDFTSERELLKLK